MGGEVNFSVDTEQFDVVGEFGKGNKFIVSSVPIGRTFRAAGSSGVGNVSRVVAVIDNVADREELPKSFAGNIRDCL